MNLNKKLKKFTGDGIPAYNAKINELIDAANWLLGIRTINGRAIAESDQGPILDLSQTNTTQPGNNPWATDPDGNPAGWKQWLVLDPNNDSVAILIWIWTSGGEQQVFLPWMVDPDGGPAGWVRHDVCEGGQVVQKWFWGTP